MSIPLITWEAPEPLGGPPAGAAVEETAANRLLQLSLQEMIQLEKDALKQQKQQQQPQQQQPKQQQPKQQPKQQQQQQQQQQRKQQPRQQPPRQQQQQQQPHQQQRRVLLRPSPALVSPEKETGGKWRELLRAVCVEALGVPDAGWPSIRLVENAEAPVPASLFVVCGGVVTPQDVLSFFQPFNPLSVQFLIPQAEAVSSDAAAAAADTCCVLFPSAAAAAAALQQRSSPCDLLLQRHKEQLVLQLQQLEMIFDSDPEEGELQQQQQQQVELLREQADSLRQLEEHKETDPDIRTCLLQLAKWRRTVSVPASSDGKSYQLLLRRTAAPDLPSAAAETAASPSKVVELRPTLNFTVAAAAAAGKASKGAPGETGGVEERALLQDTVALQQQQQQQQVCCVVYVLQASRGNFRSWVLRGGIDLGEGPLRPSSTRAKLTPRAEGDMETDALYRHWGEGAPGGPPKGSPPGTGRGAEEEPRSPLAVASHGQRGGGGPREGPPARERPRMRRSRSRSWDRHMRDRSRRGRGSSRWRRDSSSSVSWSSSHSSSSCSSREASRHRRRRRDSYEDSSKDSKNRKGRGFKAKRRGMAADRELARGEHRHRRRRDSD
ncbi:hypothetical protein Emed_004576 [Eimeria media]